MRTNGAIPGTAEIPCPFWVCRPRRLLLLKATEQTWTGWSPRTEPISFTIQARVWWLFPGAPMSQTRERLWTGPMWLCFCSFKSVSKTTWCGLKDIPEQTPPRPGQTVENRRGRPFSAPFAVRGGVQKPEGQTVPDTEMHRRTLSLPPPWLPWRQQLQ